MVGNIKNNKIFKLFSIICLPPVPREIKYEMFGRRVVVTAIEIIKGKCKIAPTTPACSPKSFVAMPLSKPAFISLETIIIPSNAFTSGKIDAENISGKFALSNSCFAYFIILKSFVIFLFLFLAK